MRISRRMNQPHDCEDTQCPKGEMKMPLRFFDEVEFQTDLTSYGVGRVIAVFPATDEVKVLDEDGCVWSGPINLVALINE